MEKSPSILYLDLEPLNNDAPKSREIGVVIDYIQYKSGSASQILEQINHYQPKFLCGHNIRPISLPSKSLGNLFSEFFSRCLPGSKRHITQTHHTDPI